MGAALLAHPDKIINVNIIIFIQKNIQKIYIYLKYNTFNIKCISYIFLK